MAKKSKREEEGASAERWLVSYADFITLMFAFFVVMYAISSVNEEKYKQFSESLKGALKSTSATVMPNEVANLSAPPPKSYLNKVLVDKRVAVLGEQQRKIEDRMKKLAYGLNQTMVSLIQEGKVGISVTRRGVVMDISASTLFDAGKADLHANSLSVLRSVAAVLSKEEMFVEVEGHTDDLLISTPQFPSNWELSSMRASTVVRTLIDYGMQESRLSAVGLAANHPLVPNDSLENRMKNRRVTITILSPNLERS
jgi:chemotaxis protein MotB